jgi:hypothetical protein
LFLCGITDELAEGQNYEITQSSGCQTFQKRKWLKLLTLSPWLMGRIPSGTADAFSLLQQHPPLTLTVGALLVLAPVALFLVLSDE